MERPKKMLEDLWKAASAYENNQFVPCVKPTVFGMPLEFYLRQVVEGFDRDDKAIERVVRDAIVGYQESYASAPNDDCEREIVARAERANVWLAEHGFEIEDLSWSKEEPPCL